MEFSSDGHITLLQSQNGYPIAQVHGIYLHSPYDPLKEAVELAYANLKIIEQNSHLLILGLGLGYHVQAIWNKSREFHGKNSRIYVLSPTIDIQQICMEKNPLDLEGTSLISAYSTEEMGQLYGHPDLVDFLLCSPAIIAHPASLQIFQKAFTQFLSHKDEQKIHDILPFVHEKKLQDYLALLPQQQTLQEFIPQLTQNNRSAVDPIDFLLFALQNIK